MKKRWLLIGVAMMVLVVLAACGNDDSKNGEKQNESNGETAKKDQETSGTASEPDNKEKKQVETTFVNSKGDNIGSAELVQTAHGVDIKLDVKGLPAGTHGIHIHEKGTCTGPDFKSAGDHFNPANKKHGIENPEGPHAGDLPNLVVKEDGIAREEFTANMVTLEKGLENSLLKTGGTSIVIHADRDDNKSQPAGNSGDRIACAEINE